MFGKILNIDDVTANVAINKENNVDVLATTPSFLSVMLEIPQMREALKNVNSYDFGAEAFSSGLYDKIVELN